MQTLGITACMAYTILHAIMGCETALLLLLSVLTNPEDQSMNEHTHCQLAHIVVHAVTAAATVPDYGENPCRHACLTLVHNHTS